MVLVAIAEVVIGHIVEGDVSWGDHSRIGLVVIDKIVKLVCSSLADH